MNWLKQMFSRHRLYREFNEEIASHLEQRIEELTAPGMSRKEAPTAPRREFGNEQFIRKTTREAWGWRWLEDFMGDIRFGLRMVRKNPVLTIAAVLTVALGIGANTAIFTLLYGLVLRSLPAREVTQLVRVGIASAAEPTQEGGSYMPYRMLQALREEQSSF